MDIRAAFLESARSEFLRYKLLGLKAIESLSEDELNRNVSEANSVAIIVKHLSGNMQSRWVNLFTADGEKPDRDRDGEFASGYHTKNDILRRYAEGWLCLEKALAELTAADFARPVLIRKEAHSLVQAVNRQISHYAYHVGQIVILAKQFKGAAWISLSIPKGKSGEHTQGAYTGP